MTPKNVMALALLLSAVAVAQGKNPPKGARGAYLAGDFHQHTYYTDGSNTFARVMAENALWDLDWWANSEHGGSRNRDGNGNFWDDTTFYPTNPIKGKVATSGGHQVMWRWQSLSEYVWPDLLGARLLYPKKTVISGLEWNVPGHEHCSTAIHQYKAGPDAISEFEYRFDKSDSDDSRTGQPSILGGNEKLTKTNSTRADAIAAVRFMQALVDQRIADAWVVPAHVERAKQYWIEDFRAWMDAGPDVSIGFEGLPGHQTSGDRGFSRGSLGGGTYGGAGFYVAKVGGLWDGLLAEGRKYYNFASSDYHDHWSEGGGDFWPGEYQKQYTYVDLMKRDRIQAIFDGNRSGNSWHVEGDLIDELDFSVKTIGGSATMGGTLKVRPGQWVLVTIKVHDPLGRNNCPLNIPNPSLAQVNINQHLARPAVDHVDLIAAHITGKVSMTNTTTPEATDYGTNARVIQRFDSLNWWRRRNGDIVMSYILRPQADMYLRLRGTNLPPNVPYETDAAGDPLPDSEANDKLYNTLDPGTLEKLLFPGIKVPNNTKLDDVAEAYADLWFYSNPIFIQVEQPKGRRWFRHFGPRR